MRLSSRLPGCPSNLVSRAGSIFVLFFGLFEMGPEWTALVSPENHMGIPSAPGVPEIRLLED